MQNITADPPITDLRPRRPGRELAFAIKDVGRMLQTYADQEVRRLGMTHSQWAVLSRIERHEGLKQSEIAGMLDLQPITLTRLLDRLCDNELIERRPDPQDRRAWRLYLLPAAKPLMAQLDALGRELSQKILNGISPTKVETMLSDLGSIRDNLRDLLNDRSGNSESSKRHG
ncbi:MAG TPA: MarR family transcriptional regulator [Pseudolabrys sp.]|nr:MarR family transcriptional regulator [Pseudolabrys sp.]